MDGSPHACFEERAAPCCLLGFIDDANSKIKHLRFVIVESTACDKEKRQLSKNLEISYWGRILQVQAQAELCNSRGARVTVEETLAGQIKIMYQGKALECKELLVRNHQGQVKNRKEIFIGIGSPVGEKTA